MQQCMVLRIIWQCFFDICLNTINASYVPWIYEKIKDNKSSENQTISLMLATIDGPNDFCVIWYAPRSIVIMAEQQ